MGHGVSECYCADGNLRLSAAFDTDDHEVLLSVLNAKFGLDGKALHWFNTYLQPSECWLGLLEGKRPDFLRAARFVCWSGPLSG